MTVQCCKCKKVNVDGRWARSHETSYDCVSHTYCPTCYERTVSEFQAERLNAVARLVRAAVRG